MKRTPSLNPSLPRLLLIFGVVVAGCSPPSSDPPNPFYSNSGGGGGNGGAARVSPLAHTETETQALLFPLGTVPYDNFSLPLVSPDGLTIATQTGVPPLYETVLASKNTGVPEATHLEIYRLIEGGQPQLITNLTVPALLGRSIDDEGFLIEAPQPDGSRWIGKASWQTGVITWLVQDQFVNAFASLGPDGQLAWSRRAIEEDHFHLVIQHGEKTFTYGEESSDHWLFPTWSGRSDGLFILHLSGPNLAVAHLIATSPAAIRQSLRTLPLIIDGSILWAHKTMSTVVNNATPQNQPLLEQLVFFHPRDSRMVIWRPWATDSRPLPLIESSIAAQIHGPDALVTTTTKLIRQNLQNPRDRIKISGGGAHIARPTTKKEWPFLLLTPREGSVQVSGLYLGAR